MIVTHTPHSRIMKVLTPRALLAAISDLPRGVLYAQCSTATGARLTAYRGGLFTTFELGAALRKPCFHAGEFRPAEVEAAGRLCEPFARLKWLAGRDDLYEGPAAWRDCIRLHAPNRAAESLLDALLMLDAGDAGEVDAVAAVVASFIEPLERLLDTRRHGHPRQGRASAAGLRATAVATVATVEAAVLAVRT
jgi:hypothetical protein